MAYNEKLAARVQERLNSLNEVEEKKMMGGLCFMLHDKMCVGIYKDELLCRIDPSIKEIVLSKPGCHLMDFTGRPMKGFVLVNEQGMKSKKDFDYWINLCLEFNPRAQSSKKKKS